MDAATILVIVLTAGVVALLVWFEINARRNNHANRKQMSDSARLELDPSRKKCSGKIESEKSRADIA